MRGAHYLSSRSSFLTKLESREHAKAFAARAMRFGVCLGFFAAAYYWTAYLSRGEFFGRSRFGLIWVPNALLLSALALTSRRKWWLILGAASIAHVLALGPVTPVWRMAWQIPINAGLVIAMTEAFRKSIGFPLRFESRREVLVYIALAFLLPVPLALTAPGFVLSVTGRETYFTPGVEFVRLLLGTLTPTLLVAPAVILGARLPSTAFTGMTKRRVIEVATVIGAVIASGILVFNSGPEIARLPWLLALALPPLVWTAVRLGPTGASLSLFCLAALSVVGATRQLGPFVSKGDDVVLSVQLFWIALCPPVLLLAAAIREREELAKALDEQRSQLAHVTRIATVGELSAELAHELRQPLTAIIANAQAAGMMLLQRPIDVAEIRAILSDIECDARHTDTVITQLRSFLKRRDSQYAPLRVESLVRDALALSSNALALAGVEVEAHVAANLASVRGDTAELVHVLLNLITNGCDAMRCTSVARRRLRLAALQPDPGHVELTVSDTGIGLPNGEAERVFEPLFTTKPEGLGLGLAVARSIATASGGRLWGENNRDGGATFHLVLPVDGATLAGSCSASASG